MLKIAILAFIVALIAGALGFTGVAQGAATVAKVTFGIFLILAVVFALMVMAGVHAIF